MERDEKKTFVKKPILNRVVRKITHGLFEACDDLIDEGFKENPKAAKFVKRVVNVCEDMVYDEFPDKSQLLPKQETSKLEGPASIEKTEVEEQSGEGKITNNPPSTNTFSDGD
jgi:hypothetical protein